MHNLGISRSASPASWGTLRPAWLLLGVLAVTPVSAQSPVTSGPPATVDEAAKRLDLQRFPVLELVGERGPRRMASLSYKARSDVKSAHRSQKTGEVLDLGYLKCIDTYCYGGGWLTALDAASGRVWQADRHGWLR